MSATVAPEPTVHSVKPTVVDDEYIAQLPWESLTQQQQWDRCLVELQRRDYASGSHPLDIDYKRREASFLGWLRLLKKAATEEEIEEERKKDDVFFGSIEESYESMFRNVSVERFSELFNSIKQDNVSGANHYTDLEEAIMLKKVFGETCGPACQCWNRNVVDSLDGVNIRKDDGDERLDKHGWLDEEWHQKNIITNPTECQYYYNAINKLWYALFENTGLKRDCMRWRARAKRRQQASADFCAKLKTEWGADKHYYGGSDTDAGIKFVHFPGRLLTMMKAQHYQP